MFNIAACFIALHADPCNKIQYVCDKIKRKRTPNYTVTQPKLQHN